MKCILDYIVLNVLNDVLVAQSDVSDCNPMGSLPGSSIHEILQARILEWVALPFFRGSSQHEDQTRVPCITGSFFTIWATRDDKYRWMVTILE